MSIQIELDNLISVSEASRRGVSSLINSAEQGREWVVLRGSKPVAGVVGIDKMRRLLHLEQTENELNSLVVLVSRFVTEFADALPLEKIMAGLGLTDGDLIAPPAADG